MMPSPDPPVLLFDGVCHFCAWSVRFVTDRDPARVFRFASLQGETGHRLLKAQGLDPEALDSVVLIEDGVAWRESDAALRVCRHLRVPWCWLWPLRFIPRILRDAAYRFIARHRYRWFGKMDTCMVPGPEMRSRFLD
jgi:predicted DCC family thiol-disulfide oxidoreductase YuxK